MAVGSKFPLEEPANGGYESFMSKLYIPCARGGPAAVSINGHPVVIVSRDAEALARSLDAVGGEYLFELDSEQHLVDGEVDVAALLECMKKGSAKESGTSDGIAQSPAAPDVSTPKEPLQVSDYANIIVLPPSTNLDEMLKQLEATLPWVH